MAEKIFLILPLPSSLAIILLVASSIYRVLVGNVMKMIKDSSAESAEALAKVVSRIGRISLSQPIQPDVQESPEKIIATAALRERGLVKLTAFARKRVSRTLAIVLIAVSGISGIVLIVLGYPLEDPSVFLDGIAILAISLTLWAALANIAVINDRCVEILGIFMDFIGDDELAEADPGPSRVVRIELIFFGLFFLLFTLDFFLEAVLDLNIPGAVSVAVYVCEFLLLGSGFTHTILRASREQRNNRP